MPAPKSFRLPDDLVDRLEAKSGAEGVSQTDLVVSLLDEGLKTRSFPGIVYRDGPTRRRAALAAGPDVWEVISTVRHVAGSGEAKIRNTSAMLSLPERWVRIAVEFYTAHAEKIDDRIRANEEAAGILRQRAARREQLLA